MDTNELVIELKGIVDNIEGIRASVRELKQASIPDDNKVFTHEVLGEGLQMIRWQIGVLASEV